MLIIVNRYYPLSSMKEIQTLIAQLSSTDSDERLRAARAIVKYGSEAEAAIPALIRVLSDPKLPVRDAVVWALNAIGEAGIEALASKSREGEIATREQALWALAKYSNVAPRKIDILLEALEDEHQSIRHSAASALSTLGKRIGVKANGRRDWLEEDEQKILPKLSKTLQKIYQDEQLNDPPYTEQALLLIESIK